MVPLAQNTTDHDLLAQTFTNQGLEFLGVAPVDLAVTNQAEAKNRYRRWLEENRHGTMSFLERHEPGKYNPGFLLPNAQSVVVVGMPYRQPRPPTPPGHGLVAQYAWGRDYHKTLLRKLKTVTAQLGVQYPHHQWRTFTDTAPLDERYWAAATGATFTARNTLAIHHQLGSWFLIGEILTTRNFSPTSSRRHGACPSGCRRCNNVCPTGALDPLGRIDARKCLSYLTIEHKGPVDDALKPAFQSWLFGCDLCQEVCPLNLKAPVTAEPEFLAWKAGPDLDLAEVLHLDGPSFTARFGGSPVHRTGRDGLVRNACLVAANQGIRALLPRIATLANDADPGVADAARWALVQMPLGGN